MPKPFKPPGPRMCAGDEEGDNAGRPCDYQAVIDFDEASSEEEEFVSRKSSKNKWKDDPDHPKHAGGSNRAPRWQRTSQSASSRSGNSSWGGSSRSGANNRSNNNNNNNNRYGGGNGNGNSNGNGNARPVGNGLHPTTDAAAASNFGWGAPTPSRNNGNMGMGRDADGDRTGYARSGSSPSVSSRSSTAAREASKPKRRSEFRCQYCDALRVEPVNDKPYPYPTPKGDGMLKSNGPIDWADCSD